MRIMALDVGAKRIGVAISDPTATIASPLTVLSARSPEIYREIATLVKDQEADLIIVGLPLTLRGEVGPQAEWVQVFVQDLEGEVPVPVEMVDERLSTVQAERYMQDAGIKKERRAGMVDAAAAAVILQSYLDWHAQQPSASD